MTLPTPSISLNAFSIDFIISRAVGLSLGLYLKHFPIISSNVATALSSFCSSTDSGTGGVLPSSSSVLQCRSDTHSSYSPGQVAKHAAQLGIDKSRYPEHKYPLAQSTFRDQDQGKTAFLLVHATEDSNAHLRSRRACLNHRVTTTALR
mmetsp:Transcript_16956/g.36899  ORF Transcript_16956/g.36899 Transcript_16956/m.36899 type:complete len:149 (-) Transcript_16956:201-647(-)